MEIIVEFAYNIACYSIIVIIVSNIILVNIYFITIIQHRISVGVSNRMNI